jgi:KaiC/GvpD/RAD55 family RecA-like ATPase
MTHRKTNIAYLDDFLEGGLKKNTITLFSAHPGVENAPFAYHILNHSLSEGESAVYVTNSKGVNAVEEDMRCNGLDVSDYKDSGKLLFVDAYSGLIRKASTEKFHPENAKNIESITNSLKEALSEVKDDHTVVVYDSVSTLIDHLGPESIEAFGTWKNILKEYNATGVFLFTEWPYSHDVLARLRHLSDAVIQLTATEKKAIQQKYLTVLKVDWVNKLKKEMKLPFNIMRHGLVVHEPKDVAGTQ